MPATCVSNDTLRALPMRPLEVLAAGISSARKRGVGLAPESQSGIRS